MNNTNNLIKIGTKVQLETHRVKGRISVNLSDLNFIDQVKLFYNAECVVGLHGGGFANTIFCEPNTKIIELKSLNAGPVIENLAKSNNLNYHTVTVKSKDVLKSKFPNQQGSIQIPINKLDEILKIWKI